MRAKLLKTGAIDLFRKASQLHHSTLLAGPDERVVCIGISRVFTIEEGLSCFDPVRADCKSHRLLVDDLQKQHIFAAAIPFDPWSQFDIIVPEVAILFSQDGQIAITSSGYSKSEVRGMLDKILEVPLTPIEACKSAPTAIYAGPSPEFRSRVNRALEVISTKELAKVVLSKFLNLTMSELPTAEELLGHLAVNRPNAYLFSIGGYVGASPELVLQSKGRQLFSRPLAGTAAAADRKALIVSHKDNQEHRIVVRQIIHRLSLAGILADSQRHPNVSSFGEIVHLGSWITGRQSSPKTLSSIELAARIFPTAAINGEPYLEALQYILSSEVERGLYGGLVGYQKHNGDGSWVLNIRSTRLTPDQLEIRAGVGIIHGSDPIQEDEEATAKINSIISSILAM